ncbi:MAG: hypothetical protein NC820_03560, partial [Candidatus Omnitrophica bacterium]|nr:hypothetical protein [Candidatus Omnitrophota bacterium]
MSPYSIPPLLSAFSFFSLGAIVLFKSKEKFSVRSVFMLNSLTTFWWQFSWFILFNIKNESLADILVKIGYSGIIFIPASFFHFYISYLDKSKRWVYFYYAIAFIFLIILWSSKAYINNYYTYFWGYYPKAGYLHPIYLTYLTIIAIHCLSTLFLAGRQIEWKGIKGNQIKYLFVGLIIYTFASFDFLVNYGIESYPLGFIPILISLSLVAYAIIKYRLMDIKLARQYLAMNIFYGVVVSAVFIALAFFLRQWFWGISIVIFLAILLGPYLHRQMIRFLEPAFLGQT